MARTSLLIALCAVAAFAAPAAAQRPWVEAKGPHFTVVSDAGAGRARDIVWQFEQIREAITRTFPWIRSASARPVLVLAARNAASMRSLEPALWDDGRDGSRFVSMSSVGRDRSYIIVRADVRIEDREGISPYQSAYWSYSAQALGETSRALPEWLVRGLAEVLSNTLVCDKEIQVGRTLPENLRLLRTRPRLALKDVVATARADMENRGGDALGTFTKTRRPAERPAIFTTPVWAYRRVPRSLLTSTCSAAIVGTSCRTCAWRR